MKVRLDFVTNSSSSSYICQICGREEIGWDLGLSEIEMIECVNGHILCREHMMPVPREKLIEEILNRKYWDEEDANFTLVYDRKDLEEKDDNELINILIEVGNGDEYDVPECFCPICQFEEYSERDMAAYLMKKYHVSKDEVFEEIKKKNKRRRKLYDFEYIAYVVDKFGLNLSEIQASWKEKYKSYKEFMEDIKGWW